MKAACAGVVCAMGLFVSGCDQFQNQNRYELSKDASGNTVRLDKRTGEIAIIKGDQIRTLKDAAQADADQKARLVTLEQFKSWQPIDSPNIGARMYLSTSWRDGKLYYNFRMSSLDEEKKMQAWLNMPADQKKAGDIPTRDAKMRDATLLRTSSYQPFNIEINDSNNFKLVAIGIAALIRLVDDDGMTNALEEKSTIPMSEEDYKRIAGWEVNWRGR